MTISSHEAKLDDVVSFLARNFEITSSPADCFVSIQIERNRKEKSIQRHQEAYIIWTLSKFRMEECNVKTVPADPSMRLTKAEPTDEKVDCPYREAVESLIYAAICTCPDIAFAVCQVAQISSNPNRSNWEAVKRVLAYLKRTLRNGK